jgi:23S rRNA (uracil1939-C5)-methyltransferase
MSVQIEIQSLSFKGKGVGRIDGKTIFVEDAVPGDLLDIFIYQDKKRYSFARINTIRKPSKHRIKAQCSHFELCGGCQWQHIEYKEQLRQKKEILKSSLEKTGISIPEITCVQSTPYHYRNRISCTIIDGKPALTKKQSKEKVAINECPVLTREVTEALFNKSWTDGPLFLQNNNGTIESSRSDALEFLQGNEEINTAIKQTIKKHVSNLPIEEMNLLDLFCGNGNLSMDLGFKKVIGYDFSSQAIQKADDIQRKLGLDYEYQSLDLEKHFPSISRSLKETDICILDPPRKGAFPLIKHFIKQFPENIIYLSCSPPDLARDVKLFTDEGYRIEAITLFDMFPQTFHIETLVLLVRS